MRLLLAVAVMGVPTFLMGGTLPAAVRSITAVGDVRRRALAVLYGVNTLGAVCGAYFATFFALEFLGTRATLWFGCAMNLLVGVIALSRSQRVPVMEMCATMRSRETGAAVARLRPRSVAVRSSMRLRRCWGSRFLRSSWCGIACSRRFSAARRLRSD